MMTSTVGSRGTKWWKEATFYQIWPASFQDSNGDGVGDIPGIISRLDYLRALGVDVIWISPMFKSPQKDMGYDISDYEDIHPAYGTLADAENLIRECHKRGIRLLFDLVVNHTSDQHAWFLESRSSRECLKRDWYIWRPPRLDSNGVRQPPNNWRSDFGGSAWEWDESTQEYYLHLFDKSQPDLNWESPVAREAIYKSAVRFWLDKGLDGFRMDTVNLYSKHPSFDDAPVVDELQDFQPGQVYWANGPRIHEFLQEMHAKTFAQYDCCTVGELLYTSSSEETLKYIAASRKELDMVFRFDVTTQSFNPKGRYDPHTISWPKIKMGLQGIQNLCRPESDAWTTTFLENHDYPRSVSSFGCTQTPDLWMKSAKALAMLIATSSGSLFIYQGQEIGMTNAPPEWNASHYRDIDALNFLQRVQAETLGHSDATETIRTALVGIGRTGRDHARTPVQWDASDKAGFTDGHPWIDVNPNHMTINVQQQSLNPDSVLNFWKKLLELRIATKGIWIYGRFQVYDVNHDHTVVYTKLDTGSKTPDGLYTGIIVAMNVTEAIRTWKVPDRWRLGELVLSNCSNYSSVGELQPWQAVIYNASVSSLHD